MKKLIALGACVALLVGCQTFDDAVAKNLPKTCQAAATVHASFIVVASTGNIKDSLVRKEAAAFAGLRKVCDDPASVNSATALVVAAEAYAAIVKAYRDAS